MKLRDIKDLDKNELLNMLGLQARPSTGAWLASGLGLFGAGLLVGASLALLVAPQTGRELRQQLGTRLRRAGGNGHGLESPGV